MMKQLLLKGPGYSGRGVRLATLSASQIDTIREEAAKVMPTDDSVTSEAKQQIWVSHQRKAGIAAMVVEVTESTGHASKDEILSATWRKTKADELLDNPEKLFTVKDLDALGDIFFRLHVAQKAEVDDILGEALDVTAD